MMHEWFNIFAEWTAVTLLNGVWGGALLIALLWLGVKITSRFRPVNASTRYVVWVTGLILCTVLMVWQGTRSIPERLTSHIELAQVSNEPVSKEQAEPTIARTSPESESAPVIADVNVEPASEPHVAQSSPSIQPAPSVIAEEEKRFSGLFPESAYSFSIQAPPLLISQAIMMAWALITLVLLAQLVLSGILVYRLKREAQKAPGLVTALANQWLQTTRTARAVEVGISNQLKSAVAVGYLHPMVLIPEKMLVALDENEIEQVVLHELSHIRRFDDWTILLQQVLKALFFFHPGVWLLSRLMNQDREIACDDQVVSLSKSPKAYANCLAKLASMQISGYAPIAVAPATSSKKQLFVRVRSILNRKLSDSYRTSRTVYCLLFLAALCGCLSITYLAPVVAFAEKDVNSVANLTSTARAESPAEPLARIANTEPVIQGQERVVEDAPEEEAGTGSVEPVIAPDGPAIMGVLAEARAIAPVVIDVGMKRQGVVLPIRSGDAVIAESPANKSIEASASALPSPIGHANSLSEKSMIRWLQAVRRISTPGEKSILLKKASHQLPTSDAVYVAFIEAAMSISTPSGKSESLLNLLIRSDLGEDATIRLLEAIRSFSSSTDRHGLMLSFFVEDERLLIKEERVEQAAKRVIESVNKDMHHQALTVLYQRTEQELNDLE